MLFVKGLKKFMAKVELVYVAMDHSTFHVHLDLAQGATVADAIKESGVEKQYPESLGLPVGIYAKQVPLETVLKEGDRVEIYRPLTQDPKDKRRKQADLKRRA